MTVLGGKKEGKGSSPHMEPLGILT